MTKAPKSLKKLKTRGTKPFIIGCEHFAEIHALEGVALSPEQFRIVDKFKRENMSSVERRKYLTAIYGLKDSGDV